jgi:hypothetical protein
VVGPWFLRRFVAATGLSRLAYVVLLPPVTTCLERVRTREQHGFRDPDATRRMHRDFVGATIDARHVVASPGEEPEGVASLLVHRWGDGSLDVAVPTP